MRSSRAVRRRALACSTLLVIGSALITAQDRQLNQNVVSIPASSRRSADDRTVDRPVNRVRHHALLRDDPAIADATVVAPGKS
jgi:hypothetical protein